MALASPDIGSPGPSASSTSPIKTYDVYLSFQWEDVRDGFASHLHMALLMKQIDTFMDYMAGGEHITDLTVRAIEQSHFAIVVFSENYASSTSCLDELVEIMESKYNKGGTVFPVFYHTDPSDIRKQSGSTGRAFEYHETRFPADKVQRWRYALQITADLSGWHATDLSGWYTTDLYGWHIFHRDEAEIVEDIVEFVWNKLYYKTSSYHDHLVGDIQSKVDEIVSLLKIGSDEICFGGIWGMAGLGKTTLAQCVYDAIHDRFEASCFLSNIREDCERHGLAYLQKKLLFDLGHMQDINDCFTGRLAIRRFSCNKKVLIILDDVSHARQLENLAGSEQWFGVGSKIIITTRDKSLLKVYKQFKIYEVESLNSHESRKVFCQRAFGRNEPAQGYSELTERMIEYAHGVPLALEVLGSYLSLRSPPEWISILEKLRHHLEFQPSIDRLYNLDSLPFLWVGLQDLYMLRTIDLSNSDYLRETPDFSGTPNLEKLFFNYCVNLIRVHESVGRLKKLVELSLRRCINLETLPTCLDMNKLEVFIVGECSKLEKLPEFSKNMRKLYFLDVRNTEITEIPLSIINLENVKYLDSTGCNKLNSMPELPPNSIIRANKDPFLASTLDLELLIESLVSKHPGVAENPIHIVVDSKGKEEIPPWFEQPELRHSKVKSGEVVTITADIPSDMANSEEELWGIAVCIIFECSLELAWRAFTIDWKFQDYDHTDDKKGGSPHRAHVDVGNPIDSTTVAVYSKKTVDDSPLPNISSFEENPQAEIECRVYKGFFPIDKEKCRHHPIGGSGQVNLTLHFLTTTNAMGKEIIQSKETNSFGDLEIVDWGWRLVCIKKDMDASGAGSRHEAESADNVINLFRHKPESAKASTGFVLNESGDGDIQSKVDMDSNSARIRHEAEISEDRAKLGDEIPSNIEHLVGDIKSKVDRIISLLKMELNDACFIGIWGDSGIGKTTLARLVYDEIQRKFDATCFLNNVRVDSKRVGIVSLQKKLLSELGLGQRDIDDISEGAEIIRNFLCHKKVLIILDDVGERSQLEYLAKNKEWFGAGSKIVITTRDNALLTMYEQFEEYEVEKLLPDESLKLLCLEAFKKDEPEQGYSDLSKEVIEYAFGIPLVLKVFGSFLCGKDEHDWRNALERLRQNPPTDISSQLRISYDGFEDDEYKRVFLDIACFLNREPKFKVKNMLELGGPDPTGGIKVLTEKSMLKVALSNSELSQNAKEDLDMLVRIRNMRRDIFLPTYLYDWLLQEASKEYLDMHDLLQEMGRNIVVEESHLNAGGRSRLWSLEDIDLVLKENKGTEHVQSIVLETQHRCFKAEWDPNCFSKMINLRLLDLSKVHLLRKLESLPIALKFLRWDDYAQDCLPSIEKLWNLESLQLCNSNIKYLWEGNPVLNKLRNIDMSGSETLSETPDFSGTPNLEELLLNKCRKLVRVHESVGQLKKLVKLNLKKCKRLEFLPTKLETSNLQEFILMGCIGLENLPDFGEDMTNIYFLDVRGTDITEISRSIIYLTSLKYLDLTLCSRLKSIPELPPNLIIYASNCGLLEPTSALQRIYASCTPKGPIHLFYDLQLWTRIPTWFERWEYCWGKYTDRPTSGEFVTITADIPSNVITDSNEERWGIAVCIVFQFLSQAWLGFSVDWKFNDKCHPKKTKINSTPAYYMHDCRVYVGFYPFEPKDCRQHASGEGSQLDLTLEFPSTNIIKGFHDLEIMGCGWRLACTKEFDERSERRSPSPPRLGFLDRKRWTSGKS